MENEIVMNPSFFAFGLLCFLAGILLTGFYLENQYNVYKINSLVCAKKLDYYVGNFDQNGYPLIDLNSLSMVQALLDKNFLACIRE